MIPGSRNHRGPTFAVGDAVGDARGTTVGDARGAERSEAPTVVPRSGPQIPMDPAWITHPHQAAG